MKLEQELKEFSAAGGAAPSEALSRGILARVRADLTPSVLSVMVKVSVFHALAGALTLSVCPQFGFRLFGSGMGLMRVFMAMGHTACMIACGFFFLASSLLLSALLLSPEELRKLRAHRVFGLAYLILLSLIFFVIVDAQVAAGFLGLWLLGSVVGGLFSLELGWLFRRNLLNLHLR